MSARTRLALLWLSQTARVLGDGCLRLVAMLELASAGRHGQLSAFHLVTALFIAPFVVLAPLNGCLSNTLSRRAVLAGSAAFALFAIAAFAATDGPWIVCTLVVGMGAALNSSARYAMLPAAARDTEIPLPRVASWIELGAAVAIVSSIALGLHLPEPGWPADGSRLAWQAVAILLAINGVCLLGAIPASFPSDQRRPERPLASIQGFFRDLRRILRDRPAAISLLALASFQALVTAGAGAIVADHLRSGREGIEAVFPSLVLAGGGAALGSGIAGLIGHPRRCLGLVPPGALGLWIVLLWAMAVISPLTGVPLIPAFWLGFMGGLINVPLRAAYLASIPADARGNGTSIMNTAVYAATALLGGLIGLLTWHEVFGTSGEQLIFLAILAALATLASGLLLFRPLVELMLAGLLLPFYRIRAHGPGQHHIPTNGPLIVVCNHSAYLDPLWLGKVVPRSLTPMMTSVFYDRPLMRFLMRWVVGAIRVQASRFRREVPELTEAVAALRRGRCLLLFPEARLRRNEETLLRNFGRGIWHILREAPDTPVVVCWLEGGWGSYASYQDGPPFTGKRMDFARRIDIAFSEPQPIPPEILADHRQTRAYLMRTCLGCRRYLGLPVPEEIEEEDSEAAE